MLNNKNAAILVAALLVFSIFAFPAFAGQKSKNDVVVTYVDNQLNAEIGKPVQWIREVTADNPRPTPKKIKVDFKNNEVDEIISVSGVVDYKIKTHSVEATVPPGISTFSILYEFGSVQLTTSVVQNNANGYIVDYNISSDQHLTDITSYFGLGDTPPIEDGWVYYNYIEYPGEPQQYLRHYVVDSNGDGKEDKMVWTTPHLSQGQGQGGGKPSPSKILNYNLQTVRANNNSLPAGFYYRYSYQTHSEVDEFNWDYFPLSDQGYDDNSSLIIRTLGPDLERQIYSPAFPGADKPFNINFYFRPNISTVCEWPFVFEMTFADGSGSDFTWGFHLSGDGSINLEGGDFDGSSTAANAGWYFVNVTSNNPIPSIDYIQASIYSSGPSGCNADAGNEFLLDNILVNYV